MMLHEVYNTTDQGMQRVLDSLAHPSMEYAIQQECLLRDSLSGMSCEQVGDSEDDLDLSFIDRPLSYVKTAPQNMTDVSFSSMLESSVYFDFPLYAA